MIWRHPSRFLIFLRKTQAFKCNHATLSHCNSQRHFPLKLYWNPPKHGEKSCILRAKPTKWVKSVRSALQCCMSRKNVAQFLMEFTSLQHSGGIHQPNALCTDRDIASHNLRQHLWFKYLWQRISFVGYIFLPRRSVFREFLNAAKNICISNDD